MYVHAFCTQGGAGGLNYDTGRYFANVLLEERKVKDRERYEMMSTAELR